MWGWIRQRTLLGWTIRCIREETYSLYVFVGTFIPCVLAQSKCHVFTSSHMLIDYLTGFKWCRVNPAQPYPHTRTHTVCTECFLERFFLEKKKKSLMDQSLALESKNKDKQENVLPCFQWNWWSWWLLALSFKERCERLSVCSAYL